ncbi:MAG: UDP-N-acetylmuramate dehydrogenase [Caldiserica bacterium]|nr:UDP-N-acetylmuramate dehydrogenase [Caldisericota bacterium]
MLRDLPGEIRPGEPLSRHTTFRIGGPAWCLFVPADRAAFVEAVSRARAEGIPWLALGGGSNVLFPDEGFPGLVIATRGLRALEADGTHLFAEAGVPLPALASRGFPALAGIPGTVGGALVMNAGTSAGSISRYVRAVEVLGHDGIPRRLPATECGFSYRSSRLKRLHLPVLGAEFVAPGDETISAEEILRKRRSTQPLGLPSAGCVFRNPPDAPPAGWLIDRAGFKGARHGDALVSPVHANFICNLGRARATDVLALIERIRDGVRRLFGVILEPEIEIVWT